MWAPLSSFFAATASSAFFVSRGRRGHVCVVCSTPVSEPFVVGTQLEDNLEGGVEHLVQASLFLGRALDVPLKIEFSRLVLKHLRRHTIFQLIWITLSLKLFSEVQFGANKNTRAVFGGSFHLRDPFVASIFQRFAVYQTKADQEAVGVGEGDRAQSSQIIVTGCIPNLELHLRSLVVLGSIVGIKNCRLVKGGEFLLSPSHDN